MHYHSTLIVLRLIFDTLVEYAMEAISHAGTVMGVLAKDGVILAAEKKVTGKLLDLSIAKEGGYGGSGEKIFLLNKCVYQSIPHRTHILFILTSNNHLYQQRCGWRGRSHSRRELPR